MTAVLLLLLIVVTLALFLTRGRLTGERERVTSLEGQLANATQQHHAALDQRAGRAVAASRGSFNGHVAQQAFPAAPGHCYHPKDIFHMGGVMDYVVFDGLYDIRHGQRDPHTLWVVFADVKWGTSRTTDVQRAVIDALNSNRTRGEVWQARASVPGQITYTRLGNQPESQGETS